MVAGWTAAVGDARLTTSTIFTSQSLTRANYENIQADGTVLAPFGIIYPKNSFDAADTPVHWFSMRQEVVLAFALNTNDPYFLVDPSDPTQGTNYTGQMGSLVEKTRQQLMLFVGSFRCYVQFPQTNLDQHFLGNTSFYALMDGKYAGHITANILIADTYSPDGQ